MLRRSPLVRKTPIRRRWEGPTVEREPRPLARVERPGVYGPAVLAAVPKECAIESAAYENAVRSLGFCVRCKRVCRPQFCHRDEGKGIGIKTDVREGWAGCDDCHALLGGHKGGGRMPKEQRRAEEDRLGAITRQEVRSRGLWPRSVPEWDESMPERKEAA